MTGTVLILGASGRFGRHAAEAFWNAGWRIRTFDRNTDHLATAAQGVDLIVNGWNPPYTEWESQVPRLTDQVIQAARISGATVLIPGNVYGYGPGAGPLITGATPKAATNKLGQIRNRMEAAYRDAGVPTIILRAGDFIDTEASGNWFESHIAANAAKGIFSAPGKTDIPHAWAYLPDVARAAAMLADKRDQLDRFQEVLFPGYTLSLSQMRDLTATALNRDVTIRRFPWWAIRLIAPFWPMGRRLLEMRYLWNMPHALDGETFHALLPTFRPTDPLTAISRSVGVNRDIHPDQPVAAGAFSVAAE